MNPSPSIRPVSHPFCQSALRLSFTQKKANCPNKRQCFQNDESEKVHHRETGFSVQTIACYYKSQLDLPTRLIFTKPSESTPPSCRRSKCTSRKPRTSGAYRPCTCRLPSQVLIFSKMTSSGSLPRATLRSSLRASSFFTSCPFLTNLFTSSAKGLALFESIILSAKQTTFCSSVLGM